MKAFTNKIKKEKMIELISLAKFKYSAQFAVKGFNVERFVRYYPEFICELYGVKRNTSEFGIAVSDFCQEYKTNNVRMEEIDHSFFVIAEKIKMEINPLKRVELGKEYNLLVDEFRDLNKPLEKFVRLWNKVKSK